MENQELSKKKKKKKEIPDFRGGWLFLCIYNTKPKQETEKLTQVYVYFV